LVLFPGFESQQTEVAASGWALTYVVLDLGGGAALIDRALGLNPNLAEAWFYGGWAFDIIAMGSQAGNVFVHHRRHPLTVVTAFPSD
jgi:hypothetical protein